MVNHALRDARRKAGWTQEELARKAGLHPVTLSRYETGDREPDLGSLRRIASALGVPLSTFIPEINPEAVA